MSHIWMIAHVIPNQINWSSSSLKLDSLTCRFCNLDKQFAVSAQNLLMGDSRITRWRRCVPHFHETFDPRIMQPEAQQVCLIKSKPSSGESVPQYSKSLPRSASILLAMFLIRSPPSTIEICLSSFDLDRTSCSLEVAAEGSM